MVVRPELRELPGFTEVIRRLPDLSLAVVYLLRAIRRH